MCVCDTKTCDTRSISAAGSPSLRPRSNSTALPCQRRSTNKPGSPNGPFTRRGAKEEAIGGVYRLGACRAPASGRSASPRLHFGHHYTRRFGHHLAHDLAETLLRV